MLYIGKGDTFCKGNRSVPLVDELDYGFWSFRRQSFQNLNGEPMESNPIVMGIYGVTTITGVASEMKRALIAKWEFYNCSLSSGEAVRIELPPTEYYYFKISFVRVWRRVSNPHFAVGIGQQHRISPWSEYSAAFNLVLHGQAPCSARSIFGLTVSRFAVSVWNSDSLTISPYRNLSNSCVRASRSRHSFAVGRLEQRRY